MNYGLLVAPPKPEDYIHKAGVFGANPLGDSPLVPDMNWRGWLPDRERQSIPGKFDTFACVTFSLLTNVEILERRIFGAAHNYSDRFLAQLTGTHKIGGNYPNVVAEALRKLGCVKESQWPFNVETFDEYYKDIPQNIKALGLEFPAEYDFGYAFVPSRAKDLLNALKYSPLTFTVHAWKKDANGLYFKESGDTDNHAVVCFNAVEGKYFEILDTYEDGDEFVKRVRWDALPQIAMRYTLCRNVKEETAWQRFLKLLRAIWS